MPELTPEERKLQEERGRFRWCVDRFNELAFDMIETKKIPHNYVIVAMDQARAETTAEICISSNLQELRRRT